MTGPLSNEQEPDFPEHFTKIYISHETFLCNTQAYYNFIPQSMCDLNHLSSQPNRY